MTTVATTDETSGLILRSTRGAAEIIVDKDYILPTKRMRTILEAVLAESTFRIVGELTWCRLSHIHVGSPRQVLSPDVVHYFLPFRSLRERRTRR